MVQNDILICESADHCTMNPNNYCPICNTALAISPHHIKPRAEGGSDDDINIIWLCRQCHDIVEEIYDRTKAEYSPWLADLIRLNGNLIKEQLIEKVCRDGKREYSKRYYEKNRDRIKELSKVWRVENRDRVREICRISNAKNREKISEYKKEYRKKNRKKLIEYGREYRKQKRKKKYESSSAFIFDQMRERLHKNIVNNTMPKS